MKSPVILLTLTSLLGACAGGDLDLATALMEARSTAGLEQVLEVETSTTDGVGRFSIVSTLVNTGDQPLTLTVRSCYLREADLRGERAGLRLEEPLMLCAGASHRITLAPGESSEPLGLSGEMPAGASRDVEVRHALEPERWEPATLRAP